MIDFHSHLIPGVDDGAETLEQTRAALAQMSEQGVRRIVTTPHLSGELTLRPDALGEYLQRVDEAWASVQELVAGEFPGMAVERGMEVMLDTPAPDLRDPRVRLAGSQFVLVEFPFMSIPPNATQALFELKLNGFRPIIAHPERYRNFSNVDDADEWRSVGGLLQMNCGSLLGKYGERAEGLAWDLLGRGWVSYLSSDYHARGTPHIRACLEVLHERGGREVAELLLELNPERMLSGEEPLPVPPFQPARSIWTKLLGRKR